MADDWDEHPAYQAAKAAAREILEVCSLSVPTMKEDKDC